MFLHIDLRPTEFAEDRDSITASLTLGERYLVQNGRISLELQWLANAAVPFVKLLIIDIDF
jgi:hypothetical protein